MTTHTWIYVLLVSFMISIVGSTPVPPMKSAHSNAKEHNLGPIHNEDAHIPWHHGFSQSDMDFLYNILSGTPQTPPSSMPSAHDHRHQDDFILNAPSHHIQEQSHQTSTPLVDHNTRSRITSTIDFQVQIHHQHPASPTLQTPSSRQKVTHPRRQTKGSLGSSTYQSPKARHFAEYEWQKQLSREDMQDIYDKIHSHWKGLASRRTMSNINSAIRQNLDLESARKIVNNNEETILRQAVLASPKDQKHIDHQIQLDDILPHTQKELDQRYLKDMRENMNKKKVDLMNNEKNWPPRHPRLEPKQIREVLKNLQEYWNRGVDTVRSRLRRHYRPELLEDLLSKTDSDDFKQAAKYLEAQTKKGFDAFLAQVNLAKRVRSGQDHPIL